MRKWVSKRARQTAQARLDQADLNLSWTIVTAPQDGWITKRNVEMGITVTAGQQIFSIVSPEVWVTANFKESSSPGYVRAAREDRVDAYPQLELKGHVDSVQLGSGSKFTAFPPEKRPAISSRSYSACRSRSSSIAASIGVLFRSAFRSSDGEGSMNEGGEADMRGGSPRTTDGQLRLWSLSRLHGDPRYDDCQCRLPHIAVDYRRAMTKRLGHSPHILSPTASC